MVTVTVGMVGKHRGAAHPPRGAVWGGLPGGGTFEQSLEEPWACWRRAMFGREVRVQARALPTGGSERESAWPWCSVPGWWQGGQTAGMGGPQGMSPRTPCQGLEVGGLEGKRAGARAQICVVTDPSEATGGTDAWAEHPAGRAGPGPSGGVRACPKAPRVAGLPLPLAPSKPAGRTGSDRSLRSALLQAQGAGRHREEDGGGGGRLVSGTVPAPWGRLMRAPQGDPGTAQDSLGGAGPPPCPPTQH